MSSKDFELLTSSKSNRWFTPPKIINDARRLMGGIDIDPCSEAIPQQWIKAKVWYNERTDGMAHVWRGRLYLNAPYGRKGKGNYGAGAWFQKAWDEYCCGNVAEGILVGRGDSDGILNLMRNCYFVEARRINFLLPEGSNSSGVPGTKIIYLGNNTDAFIDVFGDYGIVLKAVTR